MLVKWFKPLGVMSVATALCVSAWAQSQTPAAQGTGSQATGAQGTGSQATGAQGSAPQAAAPKKDWKDRAEYDLYAAITKETDPNKRLALLNDWKQKYAGTDFKQERLLLYLDTYRLLNQGANMLAAARELVTAYPSDMTGLYWLNMLIPVQPNAGTDATLIAEAEKAGNGLIQNLEAAFAKEKKPQPTSDADWNKARADMEALGHKTLGWVAMVRKNNEEAEKHFRQSIQLNGNAGEVAYWLGSVLYAQKKVPEGLFYLARASAYDGPGALQPAGRKDIDTYLTKAYTGYHGDTSGLPELKQTARANATPPAGFTIKSVKEVHEEQVAREQQEAASDPQGALWKRIKGELTGAGGDAYFESGLKGTKPPEKSFRGKVVSASAKEITLAMSDDTTAEATLRFETPVPKVDPGTTLYFTGIAQSYTREPFMVTFDAERADVVGFPAPPAKAKPAKRPGRAKRR